MLLFCYHVNDKLTFWPDHSVLSGLFVIISLPDCPVTVFSCFLSKCSSFGHMFLVMFMLVNCLGSPNFLVLHCVTSYSLYVQL